MDSKRRPSRTAPLKTRVNNYVKDFFVYSTVRSATIQSRKVGVVYRLAQLILLSYIVGYELIYNKGYQRTDTVSSVVTTKVKGQGYVPMDEFLQKKPKLTESYYNDFYKLKPDKKYRIIDTADYVVPPNEYNSIFIMTNFLRTEQTRGYCDEEPSKANCARNISCLEMGRSSNSWNGVPTGRCIPSSVEKGVNVCEVRAWCPVEHEPYRYEDTVIRNVLNHTIFIKNDIEFRKFKEKQRNIMPFITNQYISKCNYDEISDPYCPIFKLDYILKKAEPNETEKYLMLTRGGVISIEIYWNCDFDIANRCLPTYSFRRFDIQFKEKASSSGFNFRFADKYRANNSDHRVLYKAYGLRIMISVYGTGGKFNIVPLMLTIGAGFGLMSISVLVADCVMLHFTKDRKLFQKMKELEIDDDNLKLVENIVNHNKSDSVRI